MVPATLLALIGAVAINALHRDQNYHVYFKRSEKPSKQEVNNDRMYEERAPHKANTEEIESQLDSRELLNEGLDSILLNTKYNSKKDIHHDWKIKASDTISKEPTEPWVAPPYFRSLELYDDALEHIQSHFRHEAHSYKYDKNFRFIVIAVVIDGLSRLVSKNGWQSYDSNYENLVMYLARKAAVNPQESVEVIQCIFRRADERIERIKELINNDWVQYICRAQPAACDAVILSHIKVNGNQEADQEGKLLLQLGDAALTYLQSYASVFDAITEQNAYSYVVEGREALRELVVKNAAVLFTLYPAGAPNNAACIEEFGFL